MLCSGKASVDDVNISDIPAIRYHPLSEEEGWKVVLVKDLNNMKYGKLEVENLSTEEMDEMVSFVCSS